MDFMDIWCQKEATFVGNFERWRGPKTSWGPGKLPPFPVSTGLSSVSETSHVSYGDSHLFHTPLLFRQKLWGVVGVPYGVDPWCWVCKGLRPRLINHEIVLDVFQRVWSQYLNITGRRTNGDSLSWRCTVLCVSYRAVKIKQECDFRSGYIECTKLFVWVLSRLFNRSKQRYCINSV